MENAKRIAVRLHSRPDTCPQCGGKIAEIVYGMPTEQTLEMVKRGDIVLGGCCLPEEPPTWVCKRCGQHYIKD